MLAELMKFKKSIAVAGSHGKTTTTSLVGAMFDNANFDPTIVNGGIINSYSKVYLTYWLYYFFFNSAFNSSYSSIVLFMKFMVNFAFSKIPFGVRR